MGINIIVAVLFLPKESRSAGGWTVCRCNSFTACGHQKIEMLWGHAGNYHGAAFVPVA